jgi:hypothetical protein
MNPRQAKEYKHSQKRKAEEMRWNTAVQKAKAEHEEKEKKTVETYDKICDFVEEAINTEQSKADTIYGKGAKGKMNVDIKLTEGKLVIKAEFKPAEGVKPLEGRTVFGLFRSGIW